MHMRARYWLSLYISRFDVKIAVLEMVRLIRPVMDPNRTYLDNE